MQKVLTESSNKCKKNTQTIVAIYKRTKLQKYGYISTNTSYSALIMLNLVSGVRDHLPFLHSHVQLAGVSRANRMPWTMVAIDGRKKVIYNKTAKMVSVNGSSPKISSRRTEDTSSLGATHFVFSLHGKIYMSTFLSWFADPCFLQQQ